MRLFFRYKVVCYPILAVSLLLFCFACEKKESLLDVSSYYFPLDALADGKVYEYRLVNRDSFIPDFWFYKSSVEDSVSYLSKVLYGNDLMQRQLSREQKVANGMLLNALYFFESDSLGELTQTAGKILSPNAFPFEVEDSTMVVFKVEFPLPNGRQTITVNRRFVGDTTFVFEEKIIPAIYFDLEGEVDVRDSIEGDISPPFWGREIYAKHLGLVEYSRVTSPDVPMLQHRLVGILTLAEFEEMHRSK